MSDDFLATVAKEGTDPFATLETDTSPESPTETKPEGDSKAVKPEEGARTPEENLPFHKHPRWIERENELSSLREREEATARELAELKVFKEETAKRLAPETSQIPDWFKELYGENDVAWQKYREHESARDQAIEQRFIERQEKAQKQQADETAHWNKWVDSEITKLQAEGNTFDRNKLIKTMLDFRPTDEQGNFDFKAGLKIYQAMEEKPSPDAANARKEIADTVTKATRGETPKKDYMTAADLRGRSMMSL